MVEPQFKKRFDALPEIGSVVVLDGDEGKHAASVRRMRVGEAIALTDGRGAQVRGSVSAVAPKSISIKVESAERVAEPALRIRLVQALAKGDRDELAVQAATELGAIAVTPWQAERSISRWDEAKAVKGRDRWQVICDEAGKQAIRVWFPVVEPLVTTEALATYIRNRDFGTVLVLDPTSTKGLSQAVEGITADASIREVTLVVGPEGGISETELEQFEAAGAIRVHLGSDILRTSTAGMAAIAVINAANGTYR
jgi:16S rRNA (uracil1498-N3)-methyltransferase